MTNSPPDIHILDDDAVGEIEKRIDSFPLSPLQARALCQTVRALKADIATMQSGFDAYSQRIGVEKADLQSQLEQVTKERDDANERTSEAQKSVEDLSLVIFNSEQATSMRSACVEKVRAMRDERLKDLHAFENSDNHKDEADYERAVSLVLDGVITALESVSIQEQK